MSAPGPTRTEGSAHVIGGPLGTSGPAGAPRHTGAAISAAGAKGGREEASNRACGVRRGVFERNLPAVANGSQPGSPLWAQSSSRRRRRRRQSAALQDLAHGRSIEDDMKHGAPAALVCHHQDRPLIDPDADRPCHHQGRQVLCHELVINTPLLLGYLA